jgi:hypothetical protein
MQLQADDREEALVASISALCAKAEVLADLRTCHVFAACCSNLFKGRTSWTYTIETFLTPRGRTVAMPVLIKVQKAASMEDVLSTYVEWLLPAGPPNEMLGEWLGGVRSVRRKASKFGLYLALQPILEGHVPGLAKCNGEDLASVLTTCLWPLTPTRLKDPLQCKAVLADAVNHAKGWRALKRCHVVDALKKCTPTLHHATCCHWVPYTGGLATSRRACA